MVDNDGDVVNDFYDINTEDLLETSPSLLQDMDNFSELFVAEDVPIPEHWNKFPNMDSIDSKYALDMHIDPGENQNWHFNVTMNKVFIKLNSVMTVTFSYKPNDTANLTLRAMIVYTSPHDMHLQVKRCANHKATSKSLVENQDVPPEHILKCHHPNAVYVGNENSQLFGERLSIVVPLGRPVINENEIATETLMWEFLCQNSCTTGINRKSTAVIFTLENQLHEIIGKKIMQFKVCSCPKRDSQRKEDPSTQSRKRELKVPHGKRPNKMVCTTEVKIEPSTPSPTKNPDEHTVTLTMPNTESMKHVLRCAYNEVTGLMTRDKTSKSESYKPYAGKIDALINSL